MSNTLRQEHFTCQWNFIILFKINFVVYSS